MTILHKGNQGEDGEGEVEEENWVGQVGDHLLGQLGAVVVMRGQQPEALIEAGVIAILASSGSRRDDEVIAYCAEHSMVLYLIPDAMGRGFYGH